MEKKPLRLYVSSTTGGTNNYDAIFNGGGYVGIGTSSPTTLLYVTGYTGSGGYIATVANTTTRINPEHVMVVKTTGSVIAMSHC